MIRCNTALLCVDLIINDDNQAPKDNIIIFSTQSLNDELSSIVKNHARNNVAPHDNVCWMIPWSNSPNNRN